MLSKSQVQYEHPAAKSDHCGICKHFRKPHACEIVSGLIQPEDWCDRFMPAESQDQATAMRIAEHAPEKLYARNKGLLKMSHSQLHDFAKTKSKGLPKHVGKKKGFRL